MANVANKGQRIMADMYGLEIRTDYVLIDASGVNSEPQGEVKHCFEIIQIMEKRITDQ